MPPRFSIPPLTRILLVLLIALSLTNALVIFYQHVISVPYLTVVPSDSLFFPWVVVTSSLVEEDIVNFIVSGHTIFFWAKYLERAWSSAELAKFLLVVSVIPNSVAWLVYSASSPYHRQSVAIFGMRAVQAGFLVAFKQLVPEHTVTFAKGIIKIRVKHFPSIFLLVNIVVGIIFVTGTSTLLTLCGFISSWVYLRFYKVSFPDLSSDQPALLRGDASETFAFSYFFPEPLQTPIAIVSERIYDIFVAVKICTPFTAADVDASNLQAAARGEGSLPGHPSRSGPAQGSARAEAERRRALALKALDQRLQAATNKTATIDQPPAPVDSAMLGQTSYVPDGQETTSSKPS